MSRTRHHGRKAKDIHGLTDNWCSNEPKWWRTAMKHKKRRAAVRAATHSVERGDLDADFPQNAKPWIYYW